jgi:hypothetical protein
LDGSHQQFHAEATLQIGRLADLECHDFTTDPAPLSRLTVCQDQDDGLGLQADSVLRLVVERPVQTADVQIDALRHLGSTTFSFEVRSRSDRAHRPASSFIQGHLIERQKNGPGVTSPLAGAGAVDYAGHFRPAVGSDLCLAEGPRTGVVGRGVARPPGRKGRPSGRTRLR